MGVGAEGGREVEGERAKETEGGRHRREEISLRGFGAELRRDGE